MSDISSGPTGWRVNAIMGGCRGPAIQRSWLEVGFVGWHVFVLLLCFCKGTVSHIEAGSRSDLYAF